MHQVIKIELKLKVSTIPFCFPGCGVEIVLGHIAIHAVGDCMCGSVYLAPGTCQSISGVIKTTHLVLLGSLQEPELLT